jgi:hypothetical protein
MGSGQIVLDGSVRLKQYSKSCDSGTRGTLFFSEDVSGSADDKVYICIKKADGNYAYKYMTLN